LKFDDIIDATKKFAEDKFISDEQIFVDDSVSDTIEDLALTELDVENLSQYYDILASVSSFSSRMRVKVEQILAIKIFEDEVKRLEEE
tara:strand:- start:998 stop:1261 length:264 start_codon:yes stop_codon:yes gene_type:complete